MILEEKKWFVDLSPFEAFTSFAPLRQTGKQLSSEKNNKNTFKAYSNQQYIFCKDKSRKIILFLMIKCKVSMLEWRMLN